MAFPAIEQKIRFLVFTAGNGAGSRTLTGARVGDRVIGVVNLTDAAGVASTVFEGKITVADAIQQLTTDLTAKVCTVLLVGKGNPRL